MITHFILWCYLLIQGMAHIHRRSAFSKRRVVTYGQDCVGACHLKNYFFVITYLLEDEQELSLGMLICLKHINNFLCSILVFTPFALCFVTLHGIFMRFPGLTYWQDATVPVPYFLLFLCFRKATQEIFSELDETSSKSLIFPGRVSKAEREPEGGQRLATQWGGTAQALAVPTYCEEPLVASWWCPFSYKKPQDRKP
jgi:hypothetical protein